MEKYFRVGQFNLKLEDKVMISSFELNLRQSTCLLGESGSGKSLLLKKLVSDSSLYNTNGTVRFYFGESKKVENWKNTFHYSQLSFPYQKFLDSFLTDSFAMGNKLAIALKLLDHPDYFFCEQLHLSDHDFSLFLHFLKEQNIILFYVTNQIEECVFFSYLIVLKNNQIAIEGKMDLVLKEEKLMKLLGFSLPFYVNLSKQLGYYGLISKIYLNKEDLEVALWQSK